MREVPEAEIVAAATAAHAMEFIRDMPQGLGTLVGEKGVRLSGGQRQRIAIARAILKNAPVLILDGPAPAPEGFAPPRHGPTTLVIAHRLSTIEKADRIVVLQKGHIVEIGTHAELLAKGGVYAQLHRIQFSVNEAVKEN